MCNRSSNQVLKSARVSNAWILYLQNDICTILYAVSEFFPERWADALISGFTITYSGPWDNLQPGSRYAPACALDIARLLSLMIIEYTIGLISSSFAIFFSLLWKHSLSASLFSPRWSLPRYSQQNCPTPLRTLGICPIWRCKQYRHVLQISCHTRKWRMLRILVISGPMKVYFECRWKRTLQSKCLNIIWELASFQWARSQVRKKYT